MNGHVSKPASTACPAGRTARRRIIMGAWLRRAAPSARLLTTDLASRLRGARPSRIGSPGSSTAVRASLEAIRAAARERAYTELREAISGR
ncbi:MAG TPA: hypothetical protein VI006_14225, partial [Solirubrobacteraceae bacterium]